MNLFTKLLKDWEQKELDDRRVWCKIRGKQCATCTNCGCENNSKEKKEEI